MKKDFLIFIILLLLHVSCTQKPNTPGDTGPGHLGTWITTSSTTAFPRSDPVAYNGWIYAIGEVDKNYTYLPSQWNHPLHAISITQSSMPFTMLTMVQSAQINANGGLGEWISSTSLPLTGTSTTSTVKCDVKANYAENSAINVFIDPIKTIASNGYLYAFFTQATWYSKINTDGSLGAWQQTIPMPELTTITTLLSFSVPSSNGYFTQTCSYSYVPLITYYNGYIYALFTQSTWLASINPDGSVNPWKTGTSLTVPVIGITSFAVNKSLYLISDNTPCILTSSSCDIQFQYLVYKAPINPDGSLGTWILQGAWQYSIPAVTALYNNWIYMLGNYSGYQNEVVRIPINKDGSLGSVFPDTSMLLSSPYAGAAYNGYLYAFGGYPITQTSGGVYTTQSSFTTTVEYTKIYP